ncbi:MAG: hypothetical protein ACHQUC_07500 [Chlamydiales bacterium]
MVNNFIVVNTPADLTPLHNYSLAAHRSQWDLPAYLSPSPVSQPLSLRPVGERYPLAEYPDFSISDVFRGIVNLFLGNEGEKHVPVQEKNGIIVARGRRPQSLWERRLCWIAGEQDKHYKMADAATKADKWNPSKIIVEFTLRETTFEIENIRMLLNPSPLFDWKREVEQLHDKMMAIKAIKRPKDPKFDLKFLIEWECADDLETVHYQIPLIMDSLSSLDPSTRLTVKYDKLSNEMTVESTFIGKGLFFTIQLRALAMTMDIHGGLSLDQPPHIDWGQLSLKWKANSQAELNSILNFFALMYEKTFTDYTPIYSEVCVFPYFWDRTWFPTFISTMLEVEEIHDINLKMSFIETARSISPSIDNDTFARAFQDIAIEAPSMRTRERAFDIISSSNDSQLLESIVFRALEKMDEYTPLDKVVSFYYTFHNRFKNYDVAVSIVKNLLPRMLTDLQNGKIDPSENPFLLNSRMWSYFNFAYALADCIENDRPVELPSIVEYANHLIRLTKSLGRETSLEVLGRALCSKGIYI